MKDTEILSEEATVVTAFFDIGRGNFDIPRCEPRSDDKYFEYFKFWARVKNHLVVYIPTYKDSEKGYYFNEVFEIRKNFGLEEKTTIIEVDDIFSVEADIFQRMKKVEENKEYLKFRLYDSEVSNRADYDYVVMMKYWCMSDTVRRGIAKSDVVWIDFGFNHGGVFFPNSEEFDFLLSGQTNGKIQLYYLSNNNPDNIHSAQSLQLQFDSIASGLFACPAKKCERLYEMVLEATRALLMLDCIDDDQQLLLMAYRLYPEEFETHSSWWFLPLKEFWGGSHLTSKPYKIPRPKKVEPKIKTILRKIKRFVLHKKPPKKDEWLKRMNEIVVKYYGN